MSTTWKHLPNAPHISRIYESAYANIKAWRKAQPPNRATGWWAAHCDACQEIKQIGRSGLVNSWGAIAKDVRATSPKAPITGNILGLVSIQDAVLALVAYDDCAYMLDSAPDDIAMLAMLGDPKAVLLLQACKIFNSIKEQQ